LQSAGVAAVGDIRFTGRIREPITICAEGSPIAAHAPARGTKGAIIEDAIIWGEATNAGSNGLDRNEGVGEHVRTRFHQGKKAGVKLRTPEIPDPHRSKKTCFFCGTGFEGASASKVRSCRLT
jgi:hypothetical protein